jgi:hypothetical protein
MDVIIVKYKIEDKSSQSDFYNHPLHLDEHAENLNNMFSTVNFRFIHIKGKTHKHQLLLICLHMLQII